MRVNRQYSTESQQSANYVHSNSTKEKDAPKSNIGEKLIEVEKAETGSVCILLIFRKTKYICIYTKQFTFFMKKKRIAFILMYYISPQGEMESVFLLLEIYWMVLGDIDDRDERSLSIVQHRFERLAQRLVER